MKVATKTRLEQESSDEEEYFCLVCFLNPGKYGSDASAAKCEHFIGTHRSLEAVVLMVLRQSRKQYYNYKSA